MILPLGIDENGESPKLLDEDGMWAWSQQRAQAGKQTAKDAKTCARPAPPAPQAPLVESEFVHLFGSEFVPLFGMAGIDGSALDDLRLTGWCVLFGANVSQDIKNALDPLIKYRRDQVGGDGSLCQVFDGAKGGYTPGYSAAQWLAQFGVSATNQVELKGKVPFYVMIVAAPNDISFQFQYELDVYWGVGRLWLGNNPADYAAYAQAVIDNEERRIAGVSKQVSFFTPNVDPSTKLLNEALVDPLMERSMVSICFGFDMSVITGTDASRARMVDWYAGQGQRPAIYFAGSHGVLRNPDSEFQAATMGALICNDWKGGPPTKDQYMAARDLRPDTDLRGTVHLLFACYSGGWPVDSSYDGQHLCKSPAIARLPQAILSKGGLAVLGHIDKAWSYGFMADDGVNRTQEFEGILMHLARGARAGHATDAFNIRWNVVASQIANQMQNDTIGSTTALHNLWLEHDDARNYVLHGDPAVRLLL